MVTRARQRHGGNKLAMKTLVECCPLRDGWPAMIPGEAATPGSIRGSSLRNGTFNAMLCARCIDACKVYYYGRCNDGQSAQGHDCRQIVVRSEPQHTYSRLESRLSQALKWSLTITLCWLYLIKALGGIEKRHCGRGEILLMSTHYYVKTLPLHLCLFLHPPLPRHALLLSS